MKIYYRSVKNYFQRKKYRDKTPEKRKHDDTWLVSYPKSGNTWVSFLIANVINDYLDLGMEVNFYNIHHFIPDIHISRAVAADQNFGPFPRIIKSHSEYNPYYNSILLLLRDPRDVMVSFYHYRKDLNEFSGSLSDLVRDKEAGIRAWKTHTESWLNQVAASTCLKRFFFEEFKENPGEQVKSIFRYLGFDLDDKTVQEAVEKSSFDHMRKLEEETASYSLKRYRDFNFMRKGKAGEGGEKLSDSDLRYIEDVAGNVMKKLGYEIDSRNAEENAG